MYIVGIDIAKRSHEAIVIDSAGTTVVKPFSFTNNCSGYNKLMSILKKAKLDFSQLSFAMEATGHYWLALFAHLQKAGFQIQVINPVQTNSIRNFYIRQAKTDPRDALLIAEVIRFGNFTETNLHPTDIYEWFMDKISGDRCTTQKIVLPYGTDNISNIGMSGKWLMFAIGSTVYRLDTTNVANIEVVPNASYNSNQQYTFSVDDEVVINGWYYFDGQPKLYFAWKD
jgi:hypothetical protein